MRENGPVMYLLRVRRRSSKEIYGLDYVMEIYVQEHHHTNILNNILLQLHLLLQLQLSLQLHLLVTSFLQVQPQHLQPQHLQPQ